MKNTENPVVSIHYTLTNKAGEQLDSSIGAEPLSYLHGAGNIIPGLEKALSDSSVGDKLTVTIEAEDAYGERIEEQMQTVSKEMFAGIDTIEGGESLFLRKLVLGIPAQASGKNLTRPLMPPAAPIRPRHLVPTQQGVGT